MFLSALFVSRPEARYDLGHLYMLLYFFHSYVPSLNVFVSYCEILGTGQTEQFLYIAELYLSFYSTMIVVFFLLHQ